ncbi:hypothetical protein [Novosphingobium sp. Chol11]|uniref:hypothetical protein n=1 Tax=Novosphingobium sp. Chol11 TaxID=1385763 RepID=UPI0025F0EC66|nr:hypothetical protein [Novosphingobium sp. Chol11]
MSMPSRYQIGLGLISASAIVPYTATAANPVQFASDVFIERFQPAPGGRTARTLERAERLQPGDRVIFVVNWKSARTREFTVTNPMPRAVSFQRSAVGDEEVSVDGGRTWGDLETLTVRDRDGQLRHAVPEDVTHLRWRIPGEIAAQGEGQMIYRGIVR